MGRGGRSLSAADTDAQRPGFGARTEHFICVPQIRARAQGPPVLNLVDHRNPSPAEGAHE